MNAKELLVLLDRLTGQESQFCLDCMKSIEDDARDHYVEFGDSHAVLYYMSYERDDFAGAIKVLQYLTRERPRKTKTIGVPWNIPHGSRVEVRYDGKWYTGSVMANVEDNDRMIEVRTDVKVHDGKFLNGRGLSIGHESKDIRRIKDGA